MVLLPNQRNEVGGVYIVETHGRGREWRVVDEARLPSRAQPRKQTVIEGEPISRLDGLKESWLRMNECNQSE